ncbi:MULTISPECIES: hypothetical protein [Acidovorax]|uniref:hypothetical protein n=1 Tax=Acidovorax TaxID=12916 RepID=UPI00047D1158|nr:hypothetical protein [Acidovorax sp. JHL-9]
MRRILSLALVVMLVLRGLMGTALAAGFTPTPPLQDATVPALASPAQNPGDHGSVHQAAAPANCHDTPASGCSPHEASPACPGCDVCHSAMLAPPASPLQPPPLRGAVRSADTVPFASVPAARTIRPPIA